MIEEQKIYRCQIGVNIKEGYLGFEESRIVAFKIHSEIINCVTTADTSSTTPNNNMGAYGDV